MIVKLLNVLNSLKDTSVHNILLKVVSLTSTYLAVQLKNYEHFMNYKI